MEIGECTAKFVKKLEKLGAGKNPIFNPLLGEMLLQLNSSAPPNILKIRTAIGTVKSSTGYESRFEEALNFVSNNWGTVTTTIHVVTTPIVTTPIVTTPTVSRGIGARFEQQLKIEQSVKRHETVVRKKEVLKVVETLSTSGKDTRFEKAWEQLNLEQVKGWFEYLKNTGSTNYKKTCTKETGAFNAARTRAALIIDPLLTGRNIYDDTRPISDDPMGASRSEAKEASMRIVLDHFDLTDINTATHWYAKGMMLFLNRDIVIRCDGSAALAFYTLAIDTTFSASIALVKQGDPRVSGHWFLIAGASDDLTASNINAFGKTTTASWSFTVDLWGASFQKRTTTVLYPAACMVGNWTDKVVLWKV